MKPIISPHIRVRHPDHFEIGLFSIVDDFCYFSTRVKVGVGSHIAAGCSVAGGAAHTFRMGDFSSLSAGVRIWCVSSDFTNDLVMVTPPGLHLDTSHPIEGDVTLADYTGVGANSVVMPGTTVPEGTVIGSMSFVPPRSPLEPWTVYAGTPARPVKTRNRDNVLSQVARVREFLARKAQS